MRSTPDDLDEIMDLYIDNLKQKLTLCREQGSLDPKAMKEIREFLATQGVRVVPKQGSPLPELLKEVEELPFLDVQYKQ